MDLPQPLFAPDPSAADARAEAGRPPAGTMCELFGVPDEQHAALRSLCRALFDTTAQPARVTAAEEALHGFVAEPVHPPALDGVPAVVRPGQEAVAGG